jgi:hypothetical protein
MGGEWPRRSRNEKMHPMSRKTRIRCPRFRNLWNGHWWIHVRYCSTHCEALHELERRDDNHHSYTPSLSRARQSAELNDAKTV